MSFCFGVQLLQIGSGPRGGSEKGLVGLQSSKRMLTISPDAFIEPLMRIPSIQCHLEVARSLRPCTLDLLGCMSRKLLSMTLVILHIPVVAKAIFRIEKITGGEI